MSAPINLDLDFQDYTPSNEAITKVDGTSNSTKTQQSESIIRIPGVKDRTNQNAFATSQKSGSSILSILQGATAKAGISEEALRQLSWASGGLPHQQAANSPNRSWGLSYFSKYFDITTSDVLQRVLWSAVPITKKVERLDVLNDGDLIAPLAGPAVQQGTTDCGDQFDAGPKSYSYLERFIQSRPDLYGPFWISATLIFAVAIFSNIVSFINYKFQAERVSMIDHHQAQETLNKSAELMSDQITAGIDNWHYSMEELNTMSSVTMMYLTLLPIFISFLFWLRGCSKYYTLTETICAYGYSLSIYIPMSVLLMVQFMPFRYLILTLFSLASGFVLMFSFLPIAKSDPSPAGSRIILALILICHMSVGYAIHRIMLK